MDWLSEVLDLCDSMRVLVCILTRAVPNVPISSTSITTSIKSKMYYILVTPEHKEYWVRFREKYPNCLILAQERGAIIDEVACPEFTTVKNLLNWLSDVLKLSQGEKKLLYFDMNAKEY